MLIALSKEQHFGRAAERLGVTQPTLSSGIRQLEDDLGVRLVERGARYNGLTPEGVRALQMARSITGEVRQLRDEMRFAAQGLSGQLRLAVIPTALVHASDLAARMAAQHPGITFSIRALSSQEILTALEAFEIDAGLTYLNNEPLGRVARLPLYRETYRLVCRRDHPLAGRRDLSWKDLHGLRLCLLTRDMQNRRIIDRNLVEAGLSAEATMESNSNIVLATAVLRGDWVSLLPADVAEFLAQGQDLATVPIHDGHTHEVGLVAPLQEPQSPMQRALFQIAGKAGQPT